MAEQALVGRVPRLDGALVVTEEWWYYAVYLAALNCPRLDCGAVFAYGPSEAMRDALVQAFPGRRWYDVVVRTGGWTPSRACLDTWLAGCSAAIFLSQLEHDLLGDAFLERLA